MRGLKFFFFIFFVVCALVACRNTDEDHKQDKFAIFAFNGEGSELFMTVPDLTKGEISAAEKKQTPGHTVFTFRDGYYYGVEDASGEFVKYGIENGTMKQAASIPFRSVISWRPVASWFSWVNDSTLFMGSSMSGKQFVYATVDVKNMRIGSHGNLDIPLPKPHFNYGGIMGKLVDSTLYVAYMLYQYEDKQAPPGDTIYLAKIDYPSMKTQSITKDTRSTFPGGYILHWQISMVDDGDIYFIAQPGGRLRPHPKYGPGIFRIRKGADKLDPEYFFKLNDSENEEFYGLYPLGNGKALTKMVQKNTIRQFEDYYNKNVVNYYIVDLDTHQKQRIPLPADRLDFHNNIIAKGRKVFIGISSQNETSTVWEYDLDTQELKEGLQMPGHIFMMNELTQ